MKNNAAILIVEDSPEDYEACATALTEEGKIANPIIWCRDGEEALAYLRRSGKYEGANHELPGVILLDLNLPGLDGRDVLAVIKNDPAIKRLPVVVMTSSDDEVDVDRCYDAGANSYVIKPVDLDGFLKAMTRLRDYWFKIVVLPRTE